MTILETRVAAFLVKSTRTMIRDVTTGDFVLLSYPYSTLGSELGKAYYTGEVLHIKLLAGLHRNANHGQIKLTNAVRCVSVA